MSEHDSDPDNIDFHEAAAVTAAPTGFSLKPTDYGGAVQVDLALTPD